MNEAQKHADQAIEEGLNAADMDWKAKALGVVYRLCLTRETFTADDVRFVLTDKEAQTHDRRAMGGIMRQAKKQGWCVGSGVFKSSDFSHGHLHQVWKSLIYKLKETLS